MHFLDPRTLLETFGYIGLFIIVFAESGLFFGFFLPGDSLLLTAGLFAAQGVFNIWLLLPIIFVAAVLGDNVGYWFGRKTGPALFNRDDSLLFKRKNLLAAKAFYDKRGGLTLVLARFMPFIRTFAPIVAGAVEMEYRRFMLFNLIGGLLWGIGVTLAGFLLGNMFDPEVLDRYFLIIVVVVVAVSVLPTALHIWKDNRVAIMGWVRQRFAKSGEPGV